MQKPNLFESLSALGYSTVIPIIPHDATLSEQSQVNPSDRGKVPGRKNGHGTWAGFPHWQDYQAQPVDLRNWQRWGAGVGIRLGDVIAFDIDVLDDAASAQLVAHVQKTIGSAPVRVGRKPKALLVYRVTQPISKRKIRFTMPDGSTHAVELLGKGQQFVAHGIHPGTGRRYSWNTKSHTLPAFNELTELSPEMVQDAWDSVRLKISELGGKIIDEAKGSTGTGRKAIGHESTLGDPDQIKRALEVLPNKLDYEGWIRMCAAIKAAFGGDEAHYEAYQAWCLKYPENSLDDIRKRWDSIDSSELGANYVLDAARAAGYNDADDAFDVIEDDGSESAARVDRRRAQALDALFERYVWVEELKRFADINTLQLLDDKQFNMRHADIGNPSNSRTCASMVFTRDLVRRRTVWSLTYRPGGERFIEEDTGHALNTWQPTRMPIPEVVSDDDVRPWLELVEHVIPDEEAREIILDWAAYCVTYPQEKCNWAVLLGSNAQGIGKDMMFQPVIAALGERNARFVGPSDLAGGYTDWAANTKLIVIEEMHAFEKKEMMNKLKAYIAAPPAQVRVNVKYLPQYQVPNIGAYLFFSNVNNALAIEKEDRRFFIYWSPAKPAQTGIYARVAHWYEQGGMGKVARWLMQRDLILFDAKGRAPASEHKEEMRRASQSPLMDWVETGLDECRAPFDTDIVSLDDIMDRIPSRLGQQRATREGLAQVLKSCGAVSLGRFRMGRKLDTSGNDRARLYVVRHFDRVLKMNPEEVKAHFWQQRDAIEAELNELFE